MGKAALKKLKLSKKRQLEKDKFSDYKKKKKNWKQEKSKQRKKEAKASES